MPGQNNKIIASVKASMFADKSFLVTRFMLKPSHDQNFVLGLQKSLDKVDPGHKNPWDILLVVMMRSCSTSDVQGMDACRSQFFRYDRVAHPEKKLDEELNNMKGASSIPGPQLNCRMKAGKRIHRKNNPTSGVPSPPPQDHRSRSSKAPRIFTTSDRLYEEHREEYVFLHDLANILRLPKSLAVSFRNTFEAYYSMLQDPILHNQFIDLFMPLNLLLVKMFEQAVEWTDQVKLGDPADESIGIDGVALR
ncbi:MAG: hypothetical protein MZV64_34725 [Ignavibacteriales bacterium]|nr:hypothetical protein [Ignavibacteriales bacterium]